MMNKIFAYLNQNQDKLIRFLGGYMLGTVLPINPLLGLMITIIAGMFKEVYDTDNAECHTADRYDMLATWAGGLLGFIALTLKQ